MDAKSAVRAVSNHCSRGFHFRSGSVTTVVFLCEYKLIGTPVMKITESEEEVFASAPPHLQQDASIALIVSLNLVN